ncbi:olfactory receptor 14J1-like [Rhea pennata]|uniref:olfactory receptor 14J1-like n=1 Tax=Rhea pennata TaxID=8795 RepID=UPI002E2532E4
MSNSSSPNEFLLLVFPDTRKLQLLHFSLFLGIYLAALWGNGLIITAVAYDHRLYTPMYFFLLNLSLLSLSTISTIVPKSMANSLMDTRAISYTGCAAQVFLFFLLSGGDCFLLTVMAYDRYVAICKPLHYSTLTGSRTCVQIAAAAWATGFLHAFLHTANTFSIPLYQGSLSALTPRELKGTESGSGQQELPEGLQGLGSHAVLGGKVDSMEGLQAGRKEDLLGTRTGETESDQASLQDLILLGVELL